MQHDEFIGQVQQRARLDSRGAAEQATRAVLQTLSARLAGGLPTNIGDQLPPEIGRHLEPEENGAEQFGLDDFYERVADEQREAVDLPQAALHTRAVLSVLDEALTGSRLDDVKEQLPDEFSSMFEYDDVTAGLD